MITQFTGNCTSGCVNGICRYPGVCQCFEGWIDADCSRGIIAHALPIMLQQTANTPEICQPPCVNGTCNVNTGYCDCSPGYTGVSCANGETISNHYSYYYLSCYTSTDIRECDDNNGGCDQICTDFPGGYSCSCRSGFTPDGSSCSGMSN